MITKKPSYLGTGIRMNDSPDVAAIAYLVSRYPAVSHTFILSEIQYLRKLGFNIYTSSINPPDQAQEKLTSTDRKEIANTYYIKQEGPLKALISLLKTFLTSPLTFFKGFLLSLRLAGPDLKRILWHLMYAAEASLLGQWMKKHSLKHLHVHFANPAATVALITSRMFPISYSLTVHGPDEFYDVSSNNLLDKIKDAKFICCIGYYAQSQLMKLSDKGQWDKFEISPLGVDLKKFKGKENKTHSAKCKILCVGRLAPSKGTQILIEALKILLSEGQDIDLIIVGDGPEKANLQDYVLKQGMQNQVFFLGALNHDQVLNAYANADIFALASFAEGIPVVLMEAMAMEIPCVSTFVNGIPELIRDNIDGLLTYPSDAKGLAAALSKLIQNPALRQSLGQAGRRRIIEKYNLEKNVVILSRILKRRISELD
jgi:colanic acid/amylovoran biosynthesis glycosyltransferase